MKTDDLDRMDATARNGSAWPESTQSRADVLTLTAEVRRLAAELESVAAERDRLQRVEGGRKVSLPVLDGRQHAAFPGVARGWPVGDPKTGIELIAKERTRQVQAEGYDAAHDDEHGSGDLAWAAVCYAAPERVFCRKSYSSGVAFLDPWPWSQHDDRRPYIGNLPGFAPAGSEERLRLLVKAGALIAAEIDRMQRARRQVPRG
jgi:hypothetical protein